jgi:hypothetical protein
MINFPKIPRQIITFVLTELICIYSGSIISSSATSPITNNKISIHRTNNPSTMIAVMASSDCEEIGDNQEKKDLLAKKLVSYMESKGYAISRGNKQYNIVYIEGACADGTPNADEADIYNDRRIVFEFIDGEPKITGNWLATTEPGTYFTEHPLNSAGAARIAFGQYKNTWQVGIHVGPSGRAAHEGLIESANITIHRDKNKDGFRPRDLIQTGRIGLNQHRGSGHTSKRIGHESAGCLVGWSPDEHTEFMNMLKSDTRYQGNRNYRFTTTIINGDRLAEAG